MLEVFERARHFPHLDEPDRFARVLLEFLDSTEPAPIDRALLRARMTSHGRALGEQQMRVGKDEGSSRAGSTAAYPPGAVM
jgi:hypothetical protein